MKEFKLPVQIALSVTLLDRLAVEFFREYDTNPVFFLSADLYNSDRFRQIEKYFTDLRYIPFIFLSSRQDPNCIVMFNGLHQAYYIVDIDA